MRILITGGAGYLGSVMVPFFLSQGFYVTVVDNFLFNQSSLLSSVANPRFSVFRADVRNEPFMKSILTKQDVIIPLACLTGAPLCNQQPDVAKSVVCDAISMMLKHCSSDQVIIYPNTNSGYGIGSSNLECTEESPLEPISLYGKLKCSSENMILDFKNSVVFRLATVFGASPRMRLDLLVNDFTWRAVRDGFIVLFESHFKRNYIHIQDIARVFFHAISNFSQMKGNVYNVGLSSANLSKYELCMEIKKQVPNFYISEAEIGFDPDQRNYIVSNAKLESTGFIPNYNLQDGITELLKAYQIIRLNSFSNV